ncbi:hypothetical protein LX32DRAFT_43656 [Colletotrichum zoysiae]|uniref:Uncharacterized protein n=1 Tax=Colletotrichum zoysiae TaxID=1216348 RepID=A0AAD9HRC5_9PEZI|nr:hypothetical protein LX32DRAFT_43656 [Colletotrichum zoysiae]
MSWSGSWHAFQLHAVCVFQARGPIILHCPCLSPRYYVQSSCCSTTSWQAWMRPYRAPSASGYSLCGFLLWTIIDPLDFRCRHSTGPYCSGLLGCPYSLQSLEQNSC